MCDSAQESQCRNSVLECPRLARYFGGDAASWLHLQAAYELRSAEIEAAERIEREVTPVVA